MTAVAARCHASRVRRRREGLAAVVVMLRLCTTALWDSYDAARRSLWPAGYFGVMCEAVSVWPPASK